jgi:hypothetical protein
MFMDEQTVKEAEVISTGADTVNQVDDDASAAVEETNEQVGEKNADVAESTSGETQTLETSPTAEFLTSKGVKADDPEALNKVAEMYQNAERKMYEESQRRAQLERQFSQPTQFSPSDTVALAEVRAMKGQMLARDFIDSNKVSPDVEAKMCQFLEEPIALPNGDVMRRVEMVHAGMMSLDEVHKLVGGHEVDPAQLAGKVRSHTLAEVANKQRAAARGANAVQSTQFDGLTADNMGAWYAGLTAEERQDPQVQSKLASLLE